MPKKLSMTEIREYLDAVSEEIFHKEYSQLSYKQRGVLRTNLIVRNRTGEIDESTLDTLLNNVKIGF